MFGFAFVVINVVALVAGDNADEYFRLGEITIFPLVGFITLIAWLLNTGKLWFVRAFRILAVIVTTAYAGAILVDVFVAVAIAGDGFDGIFEAGTLVFLSPLMFLMWRDFRRCRWLDPNSLPHEWEIAAIRDPNSINYRPPKATPKSDQKAGKPKRRR
jgi:hypothetical protein